jgi:ParB-like chromosome segregation protein Spo0J
MSTSVKHAFRSEVVVLETARLTPLKEIDAAVRRDKKYRQIAASIEHVGIIEPIVVFAAGRGKYLVLDGHKRLDILKARSVTEVACLLATDDESYTYNKRVNYLSPIGEHHMILRNLENGVTEEEIAAALDVNVATIRAKRNLLDGICSEAAEILKDKRVGQDAFSVLRKMKAVRQTEAAGLMVAANNYSRLFARALLMGTRAELLAAPERVRTPKGVAATQKAMLEQETDALLREYKAVDESYGTEVLLLSVSCGYIERLLANARVQRYLSKRYPDILQQLQQLVVDVQGDKTRIPKLPVKKGASSAHPRLKRAAATS